MSALFPSVRSNPRLEALISELPQAHSEILAGTQTRLGVWTNYIQRQPTGYRYSQFANIYAQWLIRNGQPKPRRNPWVLHIQEEDHKLLRAWRLSNDRKTWERAVALTDLEKRCTVGSICKKIERSRLTLKRWHRAYLDEGIDGPKLTRTRAVSEQKRQSILIKKERLGQDHPRAPFRPRDQSYVMDASHSGRRLSRGTQREDINEYRIRILQVHGLQV